MSSSVRKSCEQNTIISLYICLCLFVCFSIYVFIYEMYIVFSLYMYTNLSHYCYYYYCYCNYCFCFNNTSPETPTPFHWSLICFARGQVAACRSRARGSLAGNYSSALLEVSGLRASGLDLKHPTPLATTRSLPPLDSIRLGKTSKLNPESRQQPRATVMQARPD